MKQTVDTLGNEVEKSKGYIARAEGVAQGKLENADLAVHADREQMTTETSSTWSSPAPTGSCAQLDERDGAVRDAAQARAAAAQCRARPRRWRGSAIAIGVISLATIVIGLIMPIGMFGFLAAVGLAIGVAAVLAVLRRRARSPRPMSRRPAQWRDGPALRQLSSSARAAPCPPRRRPRSTCCRRSLPPLRQTLERVDRRSIPMRRTRGG